MEFNSLFFIMIYMPLFVGTVFLVKNNTARNVLILLFSLLFYYFGDAVHFPLLLLTIVLTYAAGRMVKHNKFRYTLYLVLIIADLCFFKYGNYFAESLKAALHQADISKIIMPLGISFYTFTSISYVSDCYYGKYDAEKNLMHIAMYLSFFPVVVSGPLLRYDHFHSYLCNKEITLDSISDGLRRFIVGLSKKVIIANQLGVVSAALYTEQAELSTYLGWFAMAAYAFQEYYDFSGYSDMAIGIGHMIGYQIPENFSHPFFAHNVAEFWRRWHISLGSWFRDYVYIPLGGNRCGKRRQVLNLAIVWILTGIWHGATWNFVIWGGLHGLFVISNALFREYYQKLARTLRINTESKWWEAVQYLRTFLIVRTISVVFHAENLTIAGKVLKAMIGRGVPFSITYIRQLHILYTLFFLAAGFVFLFPKVHHFFERIRSRWIWVYDLMLVGLLGVSICFMISGSYSAFIYFNF